MLPQTFIEQMTELLGRAEAEALCRAICHTPAVTSIRVNERKRPTPPAPRAGGAATLSIEESSDTRHSAPPARGDEGVPWCSTGRYLAERPQFTYDPLFHAGAYYVQEASSMFVEQAWKAIATPPAPRAGGAECTVTKESLTDAVATPPAGGAGGVVLDLCAAPGGKSTLWRSLLPDGCLLVANEPIRQRAQVLAENMTKWGHPDVVVTSAYPEEFAPLGSFFDIIAADVPCSGEGMFRKDEQAREEWSPEAVIVCAERQWQIISDVWPALKQGGYLVYSTCTFNAEEDERMVARICRELGAEVVPIAIDAEWGIVEGENFTNEDGQQVALGYHFYPHRTKGEGIYMCLLRKTSPSTVLRINSKKNKKGKKGGKPVGGGNVKNGAAVADWLTNSSDFKLFRPASSPNGGGQEGAICAIRQSLYDDVIAVTSTVRALTAGILLAEEKGKKLIPQHALALSTALSTDAFPHQELDRDTALAYLRREAITLPSDCPRGYVIVTYGGLPLGFVNNLGTRANNLYPEQWRIRHAQ